MLDLQTNCASISRWWSSPIALVGVGAASTLLGTLLSSVINWKLQARGHRQAIELQQRQHDAEARKDRERLHRERGEEIFAANSALREALRSAVTTIAQKLEDGSFGIWDMEKLSAAERPALNRILLLVSLAYPSVAHQVNELSEAFKDLCGVRVPDVGLNVNPNVAAKELFAKLNLYTRASTRLSKDLLAAMKAVESV